MLACLFVFAYPAGRLNFWYFENSVLAWIVALIFWALSILAVRYSFNGPRMKVRYLVVHWMGISFIFSNATLLIEFIGLFLPMQNVTAVYLVVIVAFVSILFAVAISHHLSVKHLTIRSPKLDRNYRIVQISDVHIGSRQKGFMLRIVNKINSLNPDYIVITGDLIDSSAVDIETLESIRALKAPTLFSIGNHERYADLPKVIDMAAQLGMITLRQQTFHSQELTFTGIDDADDVNQVACHLPNIAPDTSKFNVLLYHRPVGWESAIEHGIDLMLSGHTHNGQIFPFNLLVKQQFPRISGLYVEGSSSLYVSSGTGTWGPLVRLGSLNEVTLFELIPETRPESRT
jgi:predicted MPP superfamily phosphohydrolase